MRLLGSVFVLGTLAIAPAAHAQFAKVDACSLLTASDAGAAIEAAVQQGRHLLEPSKGECMWTDGDINGDADHRRVVLSIMAKQAFDNLKGSARVKTEPASGVGDDAYYVLPNGGGPILNVRKDSVYFQIKILNGLKVKPRLKPDAVKAKELVLGQKAAAKA